MKYIIVVLITFIGWSVLSQERGVSQSSTEDCAYSTQGDHTEDPYAKLLAHLRGDNSKERNNREPRTRESTGQR